MLYNSASHPTNRLVKIFTSGFTSIFATSLFSLATSEALASPLLIRPLQTPRVISDYNPPPPTLPPEKDITAPSSGSQNANEEQTMGTSGGNASNIEDDSLPQESQDVLSPETSTTIADPTPTETEVIQN